LDFRRKPYEKGEEFRLCFKEIIKWTIKEKVDFTNDLIFNKEIKCTNRSKE
jgi:hypothetical protein